MPIGEASLPLFKSELEYNPPVHGTWNIVHIGMQIPESHHIYVCSDNCMRGVVMTAAEMNCLDRFSQVVLKEQDLYTGNLEEVTIEGCTDIINRLNYKPRMVMVFTVCLHHFMGSDLRRIREELSHRFDDIDIVMCLMDPIMQKEGPSPEAKLRRTEWMPIKPLAVKKRVAILGCDVAISRDSELFELIESNGYDAVMLPDCESYDDYLSLGDCEMFVSYYPTGEDGIRHLAQRLNRQSINLPASFDAKVIDECYQKLCAAMNWQMIDLESQKAKVDEAIRHLHDVIGQMPIAIDAISHPQPLSMAEWLLDHGFNVVSVYLDGVTADDMASFERLKEHYPSLMLKATIHVGMRYYHLEHDGQTIAIGQKAAFFEQTEHFVNIIQGGGMWGYQGMITLCDLIIDAYEHTKDTKDLVVRKGLGCESCI